MLRPSAPSSGRRQPTAASAPYSAAASTCKPSAPGSAPMTSAQQQLVAVDHQLARAQTLVAPCGATERSVSTPDSGA